MRLQTTNNFALDTLHSLENVHCRAIFHSIAIYVHELSKRFYMYMYMHC